MMENSIAHTIIIGSFYMTLLKNDTVGELSSHEHKENSHGTM